MQHGTGCCVDTWGRPMYVLKVIVVFFTCNAPREGAEGCLRLNWLKKHVLLLLNFAKDAHSSIPKLGDYYRCLLAISESIGTAE